MTESRVPNADWHNYAMTGMPQHYPAPLAGVWAKMRRAAAHHEALVDAVDAYLALPPYTITETVADGRKTIRAEASVPPPEDLALILGDMVQNLRSALDHMAYQFARTVKPNPSRRTQFPIMDQAPDDFGCELQVRHTPAAVRDIMEEMQSYQPEHTVGGMIGRELASLRRLSNRDKHRLLLLAERLVVPKYVASNTPEGQDSGVTFRQDPEGQWAEIIHPTDPRFGPYDAHFETQVTLIEPDLPWRSGIEGIARGLYNETATAIGAFRGEWSLLTDLT